MRPEVIQQLLDLNREFYQEFAAPFSATRARVQPGTARLLARVAPGARVLDLGCGNADLAAALAAQGFRGAYTGLDNSAGLLAAGQAALAGQAAFTARLAQADLAAEGWAAALAGEQFDWIFLLAVLHHLPGRPLRAALCRAAAEQLAPGGRLAVSVWQFGRSARLARKVQPWQRLGLAPGDVEDGDALLDWQAGGSGLRYVHQFTPERLGELAQQAGLRMTETFESDGREGNLALYQVWERADE